MDQVKAGSKIAFPLDKGVVKDIKIFAEAFVVKGKLWSYIDIEALYPAVFLFGVVSGLVEIVVEECYGFMLSLFLVEFQ